MNRAPRGGAWALLARAIGLVPRAWLAPLGALVGWLAGSLLRIRRAQVEASIARAAVLGPASVAAAMYRALGRSAVEFLWYAAHPEASAGAAVHFRGTAADVLARCVREGRGAVLAVSHTGNWELAASAIAERWPLLAVVKPIHARALDAFVTAARTRRGLRVTGAVGAFRTAERALARGELLALMIDQVPLRAAHGLEVPFLGAGALVDKAPALLALRRQAPLVVLAAQRLGALQVIHVLDVLTPPAARGSRGARGAWVEEATRASTARLEAFVRQHPSQWLWLHRRWRVPLAARSVAPLDLGPRSRR